MPRQLKDKFMNLIMMMIIMIMIMMGILREKGEGRMYPTQSPLVNRPSTDDRVSPRLNEGRNRTVAKDDDDDDDNYYYNYDGDNVNVGEDGDRGNDSCDYNDAYDYTYDAMIIMIATMVVLAITMLISSSLCKQSSYLYTFNAKKDPNRNDYIKIIVALRL